MARKNLTDVIGGSAQSVQPHPVGSKQRPTKYYNNSTKYFKAITPPPTVRKAAATPVVESEQQPSPVQRSSPRNISVTSYGKTTPVNSPKQQQVSPRTSPGLLGRHYAGCKFSEPPAPTMLPLPPQHWTLTSAATITSSRYNHATPKDGTVSTTTLNQQQISLSQQLKVLLKVQA